MRGRPGSVDKLFSFVRLEERVPPDHPLRVICGVVDEVLAGLNSDLSALYSVTGRPSIPAEMLLRAALLQAEVARSFLQGLLTLPQVKRLLSSEHFSVDGTLIDAWGSMKSFVSKDKGGEPPGPPTGRNPERDFHGEKHSHETHVRPPIRTRGFTVRGTASLPGYAIWRIC